MRHAVWYFDVISPFAYLHLSRFAELPNNLSIEFKPILFAGLLQHWGQKGPAEIEPKRRWTYRACQFWADAHGVPFRFPAARPSSRPGTNSTCFSARCAPPGSSRA